LTQDFKSGAELPSRSDYWRYKGFPSRTENSADATYIGRPLADCGFLLPIMLLKRSALNHNLRTMADWCSREGVLFAPHGKAAMSPLLALEQLKLGAWGITVAGISQARVFRKFGIASILLANELVDPNGIAWVARELERDAAFQFLCYVDSVEGVRILEDNLSRNGFAQRIRVLLEVGAIGGRSGCRTKEEAVAVLRAVEASSKIAIVGIAAYEGILAHENDPQSISVIRDYCNTVRQIGNHVLAARTIVTEPGEPWIITAGGSAYFDVVTLELRGGWPGTTSALILRSGAYVTHDLGTYSRLSPFGRRIMLGTPLQPALELLAHALSIPEEGLAIVGAGRRDLPYDEGFPVPTSYQPNGTRRPDVLCGWGVAEMDDQHTYLRTLVDSPDSPVSPLRVGDIIHFGISHPCSALDRWRLLPVVDDLVRVVDYVETYF